MFAVAVPRGKENFRRIIKKLIFINRLTKVVSTQETEIHSTISRIDKHIHKTSNVYEYAHNRNITYSLPWYIINPEALYKKIWDIGSLLIVVYFAFVIPYRIGFDIQLSKSELGFDFFTDIVFMCDIILTFFTAYPALNGDLVYDNKKIALAYIKGWFPIDFISSFPLSWILEGIDAVTGKSDVNDSQYANINKVVRMIRLIKLTRLVRIIKFFPRIMLLIDTYVKIKPALLKFIKVFISLILSWHFMASFYWFVVDTEYGGKSTCPGQNSTSIQCYINYCLCDGEYTILPYTDTSWYNEYDPDLWVPPPNSIHWPNSHKYMRALFWAVQATTSVGGNIIPRSDVEVIFTIIMIMSGLVMYAVFIGTAASVIQNADPEQQRQQEHVDIITNYMQKKKVPMYFQKIIKDYYKHYWSSSANVNESMLDGLPEVLRSRLSTIINRNLIDTCDILRTVPYNIYIDLIPQFENRVFLPGDTIIREGVCDKTLYIIKSGVVDCLLFNNNTIFKTLNQGDYFGDECLIDGTKSKCFYRCVDFVDCILIRDTLFQEICVKAPYFLNRIRMLLIVEKNNRMKKELEILEEHDASATSNTTIHTQTCTVLYHTMCKLCRKYYTRATDIYKHCSHSIHTRTIELRRKIERCATSTRRISTEFYQYTRQSAENGITFCKEFVRSRWRRHMTRIHALRNDNDYL